MTARRHTSPEVLRAGNRILCRAYGHLPWKRILPAEPGSAAILTELVCSRCEQSFGWDAIPIDTAKELDSSP